MNKNKKNPRPGRRRGKSREETADKWPTACQRGVGVRSRPGRIGGLTQPITERNGHGNRTPGATACGIHPRAGNTHRTHRVRALHKRAKHCFARQSDNPTTARLNASKQPSIHFSRRDSRRTLIRSPLGSGTKASRSLAAVYAPNAAMLVLLVIFPVVMRPSLFRGFRPLQINRECGDRPCAGRVPGALALSAQTGLDARLLGAAGGRSGFCSRVPIARLRTACIRRIGRPHSGLPDFE